MKMLLLLFISYMIIMPSFAFAEQADTTNSIALLSADSDLQENLPGKEIQVFGYTLLPTSDLNILLQELTSTKQSLSNSDATNKILQTEINSLVQQAANYEETPQTCELEELGHQAETAAAQQTIAFNCIRRYILSVLPVAINVDSGGRNFLDALLGFSPEAQWVSDQEPSVQLSIHNTSSNTIIAADIFIEVKGITASTKYFRLYATYPIDPGTVGTLTGDILVDDSSIQKFWDTYSWGLSAVWADPQS